jgi:hypothetical protein
MERTELTRNSVRLPLRRLRHLCARNTDHRALQVSYDQGIHIWRLQHDCWPLPCPLNNNITHLTQTSVIRRIKLSVQLEVEWWHSMPGRWHKSPQQCGLQGRVHHPSRPKVASGVRCTRYAGSLHRGVLLASFLRMRCSLLLARLCVVARQVTESSHDYYKACVSVGSTCD